MFTKQIPLFRLFGFSVKIDLSWIVIAVLVTWSLAVGLFPQFFEGFSTATYWYMGIAGAVGLFASIVVHEFAHSLVARQHGMEMRGITLFIFGGVAEMPDEPTDPKTEFLVAIIGPITSIAIAGIAYGITFVGRGAGWPEQITAVTWYLALINGLLAAFNMLPAFPLDGGRVLRSILWKFQGSLRRATRITSQIGSGFGFALIGLGLLSVLYGNLIGGIWWFLLGMFLRGAAQMSYQQLLIRRMLEGEKVSDVMRPNVETVPSAVSLHDFVEEYVYKHHFKMFPVVDDGHLRGCITTRQVKEVPREQWGRRTVGEVAQSCDADNTIGPTTDAAKALAKMNSSQASRLLVAEGDRLVGIISLKDLMGLISRRLELEEE